jgi:hypothetical protein
MDREKLQETLSKHGKWLRSEDGGERADLSEANLRGADLSEADLRGADLTGATLRGANLTGADLTGADLTGADLRGANLRGADLSEADLSEADLRGANLRGADLREADIDFSSWPLWCGSFDMTVDRRIFAQLAYHLCIVICDDPEVKAAQEMLKPIANTSHIITKHGKSLL